MQQITRIRYNDDYELLVKEITYSNHKFSCYDDVLLYVNMLICLDGDWKLPNYTQCVNICAKITRYSSWANAILLDNYQYCHLGAMSSIKYEHDIIFYTILAISLQYKPTIKRRFLTWLKNTTVANIVTRF
jgi:hypothetical protein